MRSDSVVLSRLVREQQALERREFLAPAMESGKVRVRVGRMVWECPLAQRFSGWGVFRIQSYRAHLVREAEVWEREEYMGRFPRRPLTLVHAAQDGVWWAHDGQRFAAVLLVEGALRFDCIQAAAEGPNLWFAGPSPSASPQRAQALRDALREYQEAETLQVTPYERMLYAQVLDAVTREGESRSLRDIRNALQLGGARLSEYRPVANGGYQVRWVKGSNEMLTVLDRNLAVTSAGICMSGKEREHDLTSLSSLMPLQRPMMGYEGGGPY